MPEQHRDPVGRITNALGSPALGALVGITGLAVPVIGWAAERVNLKVLLLVQSALILVLVASHLWVRKMYIHLRKANNLKAMDDAPGTTTWSAPSPNANSSPTTARLPMATCVSTRARYPASPSC